MRLDPLELDRRTRATLARLTTHGKPGSLAACRDLIDIGFDARTAWRMVELVLDVEAAAGDQHVERARLESEVVDAIVTVHAATEAAWDPPVIVPPKDRR